MCYYALSNLVAQEYPLTHPKDVLLSNFEYVIQRTHITDNNGNWHFEYNILPGGNINSGRWFITEISTFSAFNPQEIIFNITDPSGMSDKEIGVLKYKANLSTEGYISFSGTSLNSLNLGFEFFRKLSLYINWYHFLLSIVAGNFSTAQILRFRNLEIKCKEFENKLTRISDIIN